MHFWCNSPWSLLLINNYWMRLSMISWIISKPRSVLLSIVSQRLRQIIQTRGFDNSWYHAKTEFNNCFIIPFLNNRQKKTFICWKNGFISKLRWKWRKYGAGTRQLGKAVMDKRFVDSLKLKDSLFIANFTVCIVEDLKVLSGTRLGQDVFPGLRSKWYENSFEFLTFSTSTAPQTS